jgi:hypothetical protein
MPVSLSGQYRRKSFAGKVESSEDQLNFLSLPSPSWRPMSLILFLRRSRLAIQLSSTQM